MPIRRDILTDGITSEPQIIISAPLDEGDLLAYVQEHNREWDRCGMFAGRVADLERLCRRDFDAWRASVQHRESIAIEYGSREWYAREILIVIAEVREALTRGDWQRAASDAVVVGALAAEAEAKLHWLVVKLGIKNRTSTQAAGRTRGANIAKEARDLDRQIQRTLDRYKSSDSRPTVRMLARDLEKDRRTIGRHLKRMGITIARF